MYILYVPWKHDYPGLVIINCCKKWRRDTEIHRKADIRQPGCYDKETEVPD